MVSCQKELGLIITILCLLYSETISAKDDADIPCKFGELLQCQLNESCDQTEDLKPTGFCVCIKGYARTLPDRTCTRVIPAIPPDVPSTISPAPATLPVYSSSHIIVGILIPLALVALALCLVYAAKHYQWLQRLRAMRQRRYDEVQFGQEEDDPPLA